MMMNLKCRALLALAMLSAACGVSEQPEQAPGEISTEEAGLSPFTDTYVRAEADLKPCTGTLCSGYFLTDLNTQSPEGKGYANYLVFSGLSAEDQALVLKTPANERILFGRLGRVEPGVPAAFLVKKAFIGLPGVAASRNASFVTVAFNGIACEMAPCPSETASFVNTPRTELLTGLDVSPALKPLVDGEWLAQRIYDGRAIVGGFITHGPTEPGGTHVILRAEQVFVELPEAVGPCPELLIPECSFGTFPSFARSYENRCLEFQACVPHGPETLCAPFIPSCSPGYILQWWASVSGCPEYACDPGWSLSN